MCGLLSPDSKLLYFIETSGQKLVRKRIVVYEASFREDEFSFVLIEAPTNFNDNSLKVERCEDALAVL